MTCRNLVEKPIGVVTGLQSEAAIARKIHGAVVLCHGPGPDKAQKAAQALVGRGVASLMSFGIAGGLDPALQPGDLIAAPTDLALWLKAAAQTIVTVTEPALTQHDKSRLYSKSGASAVDMETRAVSAVADENGLPFFILRAICDTALDSIPTSALKGVSATGETQPVRVAAGLLKRPQDLSALMTLGQRQKVALAALDRAAGLVSQTQGD